MELCSITPYNKSAWMYENKTVMLLTHLVERYPEYIEEALKHPNNYKILDNSLIELKGALSMERLINAADKIKANEIIIEDVFLDGEKTLIKAKEAIQWLKNENLLGKYKLMAVAHGKDIVEWEECFNGLNELPEIDVIGVPKVCSSWLVTKCRGELAPIFMKTNKKIHFLGSWYSLNELLSLDKEIWHKVRSCDTCLPSLLVIQNKSLYEDREGTIDLEKDYPELTKEKYNLLLSQFNNKVEENFNV